MKKRFTIFFVAVCACFICVNANAQLSKSKNPGSAINESPNCNTCSGSVWGDPHLVFIMDGAAATVELAEYPYCNMSDCYRSRGLIITNFNFNIPPTATIQGIKVKWVNKAAGTSVKDLTVKLTYNGQSVGANKKKAAAWPASYKSRNYGGMTDSWGTTWTPLQINDTSFGVIYKAQNTDIGDSAILYADNAKITVYYMAFNRLDSQMRDVSIASESFSISPNPVNEILTISSKDDFSNAKVRIFDAVGSMVLARGQPYGNEGREIQFDVGNLPDGIYFLSIKRGDLIIVKKFVKQ